ncbi:hypothetical protein [Rhodopirellula baltica]|nr:hypothetical protein [Rhodopirellula baltica]
MLEQSVGLVAEMLDLEKPKPEIRKDFSVQDSVFGFGFLYQACFHPSRRPWQSFIVDAADAEDYVNKHWSGRLRRV